MQKNRRGTSLVTDQLDRPLQLKRILEQKRFGAGFCLLRRIEGLLLSRKKGGVGFRTTLFMNNMRGCTDQIIELDCICSCS